MKKPVLIGGIAVLVTLVLGGVLLAVWTDKELAISPPVGSSVNASPAATIQFAGARSVGIVDSWPVQLEDPVSGFCQGDPGTFYAFTGTYGNTIYALDRAGKIKWQYQVPVEWRAINSLESKGVGALYAVDNGTLYLYVRENKTTLFNSAFPTADTLDDQPLQNDGLLKKEHFQLKDGLLAISPEGKLMWYAPISDEYHFRESTSVIVKNGSVYVFDDYNETVIDGNGSVLFKIYDVVSQGAVDDTGYCYVVTVGPSKLSGSIDYDDPYAARAALEWLPRMPGDEIRAYYPNGTLYWSVKTPAQVVRAPEPDRSSQTPGAATLPIYQNGILYVPFANGIEAIYANGTVKWTKDFGEQQVRLTSATPVDSQSRVSIYLDEGTIFLKKGGYGFILSDGSDTILDSGKDGGLGQGLYPAKTYEVTHASSGERYTLYQGPETEGATIKMPVGSYPLLAEIYPVKLQDIDFSDLGKDIITATSPEKSDGPVWNHTLAYKGTEATLTSENVKWLVTPYFSRVFVGNTTCVNSESRLTENGGVVYASIYAANFEWPIVINQSRCAYFSGLYALDGTNGSIVWEKELEYPVTGMIVEDGTIYYATRDGMIAREQVLKPLNASIAEEVKPASGITAEDIGKVAGGTAGGVAVTAAVYYALKFLGGAGAVSRARDRLGKNKNRNIVLEFITANPGSTLHEIAHELDMNVGTVRYHLLILGMNHRITTYKADAKYVRYIPCSGTYSPEERIVLSLLKRDAVKRMLHLLLVKPGLSNGEISRELNMHDSAISRYTRELVDKGVILKSLTGDGRSAYSIKHEYMESISGTITHGNDRSGKE